jgi:hypothetical protein
MVFKSRESWLSSAFLSVVVCGAGALVYLASCGKQPELASYDRASRQSNRILALSAQIDRAASCGQVRSNLEELSRILRDPAGYSGYPGYTGYSGYEGYTGYTGYQGYDGYSGYTGYTGYDGYSGYTGYTGYDGYSGYAGYTGYDGYTGYTGYAGCNGDSSPGATALPQLSQLRSQLLESDRRLGCALGNQIGALLPDRTGGTR